MWDARIRNVGNVGLAFRCHACTNLLRYPVDTFLSFVALGVLPIVLMALARDSGMAGWSAIPALLAPYWIALGAGYSVLATPMLVSAGSRLTR